MRRWYYTDRIENFVDTPWETVLGHLASALSFSIETSQRDAWIIQIKSLQRVLEPFRHRGKVYLEFAVPRMGKRIDVLAVIEHVVFVLEFKVGASEFTSGAIDQVCDYALDLKNFHKMSRDKPIAPILVATRAARGDKPVQCVQHLDAVLRVIRSTCEGLGGVIRQVLGCCKGEAIDIEMWEAGRYCPTPTTVEAALALYGGHSVEDISRNDASAINLSRTSDAVSEIIRYSRDHSIKSICFVTGVPGAGKTLVGLNIATKHIDQSSDLYSVFLSGNGPLVAVLREALARDKVRREAEKGRQLKLGQARSEVKTFIQNVHHFRDECLIDAERPPIEHVALFDEAQRAWNQEQTAKFMRQKKGWADFAQSEPEFLVSCLDRHRDWAVVVCLVGGGQEINTGEAGIGEWMRVVRESFQDWQIYISSRLHDAEYGAGQVIADIRGASNVTIENDLHLGVSMRSFRAESVSALIKSILDHDAAEAFQLNQSVCDRYPIVITRDLCAAKFWLRQQARGTERVGMVVSSQAQRLKPLAIDVRASVDPVHWFLHNKEDVRSSYYLEDAATEFDIQGLELDWVCVVWDGDFRYAPDGWQHFSFVGARWNRIRRHERQVYQKNAYRVLLTRARQGMVIVVPTGDESDPTRDPSIYDPTFEYLKRIGFRVI